jgi:hypothetical protein
MQLDHSYFIYLYLMDKIHFEFSEITKLHKTITFLELIGVI